jgi:hypothetical protein
MCVIACSTLAAESPASAACRVAVAAARGGGTAEVHRPQHRQQATQQAHIRKRVPTDPPFPPPIPTKGTKLNY